MKIALIFPGQGSQAIEMGVSVYNHFKAAQTIAEQADQILGYSLSDLMFHGPMEVLSQTEYTQPAILTTSVMILRACEAQDPHLYAKIACVAGHSVGEYAALVAAQVISFSDAIRLVACRSKAMQEASPHYADGSARGGMCAILGLEKEQIQQIITETFGNEAMHCSIANDNCPGQIVITGLKEDVEKIRQIALDAGAKKGVMLAVSGPFHSPFMQPAADKMREILKDIQFNDPIVPVIPNISATLTTSGEVLKQALIEQVSGQVRWTESATIFPQLGVQRILEIGNGRTLSGITKRCLPSMDIVSIQTADDILAEFKEEGD